MPNEGSYLFGPSASPAMESRVAENGQQTTANDCTSICKPNWKLIPSKIFYFTFLSSVAVSMPYSSVFMKQLGMSAFRIGVISGVRPFVGFVSGVCWGILADKLKLWRGMLLTSIFFWGFFCILFYMIPDPDRKSTCPQSEENSTFYMEANNQNISWLYEESSLMKAFIYCILCICVGELLQSPTSTIGDTLTLKALGSDGLKKYGWQRAWGSLGMSLSSLLAGYLLLQRRWTETICGVTISFSDYRILSLLVSIFISICFFGSLYLENGGSSSKEDKERSSLTWSVVKLFGSLHYSSWLASVLYMGYCNGTIWGFVFWHLDNLGGSQLLMGIDSLCMNIVETIAFSAATILIDKIGHICVIYVSLFSYALRFALYASLTNPWWVIPIDILQGVTFSISWISISTYTTLMVPMESLATTQGIVHGVLFGLGNGLGHLISGILIEYYGAVWTFYGMGVASVVVLIFFSICQYVGKKPYDKNTDIGQ